MRRAGLAPSRARQATAWLVEKAAGLKMRIDDPTDGALQLLETLEGLALGIDGKRALWDGLTVVAVDVPALQGIDYARLIQRAQAQRGRVEALRLEAAKAALGAVNPTDTRDRGSSHESPTASMATASVRVSAGPDRR